MTTKRLSWRLADLIDYECFLDADERESADLHARDRAIYLEKIAPGLPALAGPRAGGPLPRTERRSILRQWLEERRRRELARPSSQADEVLLPGEAFRQIRSTVATALAFLGLLIGWAAATAALLYSAGSEPINAFLFFVEFAAIQVVILLGAFAVLTARAWFPEWRIPSLMRFFLRLAASAAGALWRKNRVRLAGTHRQDAEALFGVLRARQTLYRPVLVWSLVALTQVFAISFNMGVLGAMTARHLFHDLDFGWESTWLDASQVSRATRLIAAPWSWAVAPGYPNAQQVSGSQNRKRGSERLDPGSLKSWSQFLFGVVICYGLLPRVVLLGLAARAQGSSLRRLAFNDGRSALTLSRVLTPTVLTRGPADVREAPVSLPGLSSDLPVSDLPVAGPVGAGVSPAAPGSNDAPLLILNLTGQPFDAREAAAAAGREGDAARASVFEAGTVALEADEQAFATLGRTVAAAPEAEVFALLPSWTPPMIASKLLLDQLRANAGRETLITLALVGRPAPDGTHKPVRPGDRALWVAAIQTRGDAFLCLL